MKRITTFAGLINIALLASAIAMVDLPGDEATNRKLLEAWKKSDPEKLGRIGQCLQYFKSRPEAEQQRLRQFDKCLHELDSAEQLRLRGVMERYAAWLSRLPDDDRHRIMNATSGDERLKAIDAELARQWQRALPKSDKDRLAQANPGDREQILEQLRQDEQERKKLRASARRTVEEAATLGFMPLGLGEFRDKVQLFLDESLRPLLNSIEEIKLSRQATKNFGPMAYFATIHELAQRHLLPVGSPPTLGLPFPGPAPVGKKKAVRYLRELPPEVVQVIGNPAPQSIMDLEGQWPQFPIAVSEFVKQNKLDIPANVLGPVKIDDLPPAVRRFVHDELSPKLSESDRRQLSQTMGKWPDFPKKIRELSDRYRLVIPGLNLPANEEVWQRITRPARLNRPPMPSN